MADSKTIFILNGPNLNMLGSRETEVYGTMSLNDIESMCRDRAGALGYGVDFRQSNNEGDLVDWVQESEASACGTIINAGAYTHTSIALLDALRLVRHPIVEVHLSNIFRREPYRHHSYVSDAATGIISGFGAQGYVLAVDAIDGALNSEGAGE